MAGDMTGDVLLGGREPHRRQARLRFIADNRLHHKCILEVADVVAVLRVALVDACEGENGARHREAISRVAQLQIQSQLKL